MSRAQSADLDVPEAPGLKERRFVYSGETGNGPSEYMTRGNKPLKRRKKSPFKIVSLIAAISILIVFYVWNKLAVNRLASEVDVLELKLKKTESINEEYRSEIGRKSNLDKITRLAKDKLLMIESPDPPVYFEVENYEPRPQDTQR
jgi:cell division protein FtsL